MERTLVLKPSGGITPGICLAKKAGSLVISSPFLEINLAL